MEDEDKTKEELLNELVELRQRVSEMEKLQTEHKKIEVLLRESEEKFRLAFENAKDAILWADPEAGLIINCNKAAEILLEKKREEIIGSHQTMLHPPEKRGYFANQFKRHIEEKGAVDDEAEVITKSGKITPVHITASATLVAGRPVMQGIFRDITEQKQTEKILKESEEKFRTLAEDSPNMIFINKKGRVVYANKRCEEMMGYKRAEFYSPDFDFLILIAPEYRELIRANFNRHIKGEDVPPCEYALITKDGQRIEAILATRLIEYGGGGGGMNAILGIVTDISGRKRAEEALRQSEEKYRSLVNNLNIGIYRSTGVVSGRFLEANPAIAEMFGYDSVGKFRNVAVSKLYQDPEDRKRFTEKIEKEGLVKNEELRLQKKDGTPIWASCTARLQYDANGGIKWIDGVIEDITGRKQAEEELKQTMAELDRSNKELEQFAYMLSHDLKQPLTSVVNLIELLKLRYWDRLDDRANTFITSALNEAGRMQRMIDDILALSRMGTRGNPFEPTDCEDVLARTLVHLEMRIKESGAVITHDPLPTVMADEAQLVRLFQNLLSNAIKFRGKEPPRIHISAKSISDSAFCIPHSAIEKGWVFSVSDNGIGIEAQFKERIFVIFQRLHTKEEYPGTGIGLAICKKIVEHHNGRIWVESEPGKGTTFYFTIVKTN